MVDLDPGLPESLLGDRLWLGGRERLGEVGRGGQRGERLKELRGRETEGWMRRRLRESGMERASEHPCHSPSLSAG